MYAWIWGKLPGRAVSKTICALLLISAVVALMWFVIFPGIEPLLPFSDVTVETS